MYHTAVARGCAAALYALATGTPLPMAPETDWDDVTGGGPCATVVRLTDLLCGEVQQKTACGSCGTTGTLALRLASNMIRVAAQRIFADAEQSVLELPTNSLDAHAELCGLPVTGKFGAGFFSVLFWLFEPGNPVAHLRTVTVLSRRPGGAAVAFRIARDGPDGDLVADRQEEAAAAGAVGAGSVVALDFAAAPLTAAQVAAMRAYILRLRYASVSPVWLTLLDAGPTPELVNATMQQQHGGWAMPVRVELGRTLYRVTDSGVGMDWGTVLRQLLVPFRSSKARPVTVAVPSGAAPVGGGVTGFHARGIAHTHARAVVVVGNVVVIETEFAPGHGGEALDVVFGLCAATPVPVSRDDVMDAASLAPALDALFQTALDTDRLPLLQRAVAAIGLYRPGSTVALVERLDGLLAGLAADPGVATVPDEHWATLFSGFRQGAQEGGLRLVPVLCGSPSAVSAQRVLAWATRTGRASGPATAHLQRHLGGCTAIDLPEVPSVSAETGGLDRVLFVCAANPAVPRPDATDGAVKAWAVCTSMRFPSAGIYVETLEWSVPVLPGYYSKLRERPASEAFGSKGLRADAHGVVRTLEAKGLPPGSVHDGLNAFFAVDDIIGSTGTDTEGFSDERLAQARERMADLRVALSGFFGKLYRAHLRGELVSKTRGAAGMMSGLGVTLHPCGPSNHEVRMCRSCAEWVRAVGVRWVLDAMVQDVTAFAANPAFRVLVETAHCMLVGCDSYARQWTLLRSAVCMGGHEGPERVRQLRALVSDRHGTQAGFLDRVVLCGAVARTVATIAADPRLHGVLAGASAADVAGAFDVLERQHASGRVGGRRAVEVALSSDAASTGSLFRLVDPLVQTLTLALDLAHRAAHPLPDDTGPAVPTIPATGSLVHRLRLSCLFRWVFERAETDTADPGGAWWESVPAACGASAVQALAIAINEGTTRDPLLAAVTELFQNAVDATRGTEHEGLVSATITYRPDTVEIAVGNPGVMRAANLLAMSVPFLSTKDSSQLGPTASAGEMGSGFFSVYRPPILGVRVASGRLRVVDTPEADPGGRVVDVLRGLVVLDDAQLAAEADAAADAGADAIAENDEARPHFPETNAGWTRVALVVSHDTARYAVPAVGALLRERLCVFCPRLRLDGRLVRDDPTTGITEPALVAGTADTAELFALVPHRDADAARPVRVVLPSYVFTREVPLRQLDWLVAGLEPDRRPPEWVSTLMTEGAAIRLGPGAYEPVQTRSRARLKPRAARMVTDELFGAAAVHVWIARMLAGGRLTRLFPGFANPDVLTAMSSLAGVPTGARVWNARGVRDYDGPLGFWCYYTHRPSGTSVHGVMEPLAVLPADQRAAAIGALDLPEAVRAAVAAWFANKPQYALPGLRMSPVPPHVVTDGDRREVSCLLAYMRALWPLVLGGARDGHPFPPVVVQVGNRRVDHGVGFLRPGGFAIGSVPMFEIVVGCQDWPPELAAADRSEDDFLRDILFGRAARWIGFRTDAAVRRAVEKAMLFVTGTERSVRPADFVRNQEERFNAILAQTTFVHDVYGLVRAAAAVPHPVPWGPA